MDPTTTTTNPDGQSLPTATPQDSNTTNPSMPPTTTATSSQSIPGLSSIPGLGSLPPPTAAPAPQNQVETESTQHTEAAPATTTGDDGPSVTNALEAMLGGLSPETTAAEDTPAAVAATGGAEDTAMEDSHPHTETAPALATEAAAAAAAAAAGPDDAAMMDYIPPTTTTADGTIPADTEGAAEFEADSSPYESSSDSSSDSDSSDEDSDDEDGYNLLSPAEQARILMLGDGGSDDEGGGGKGGKSSGNQLRTKNEVPDEVIPKPDVELAADTPVTELGTVTSIVDTMVLVAATTSGEFRVLESGSLLCLEDRSVIGVVSETLGRVQEPLYVVRFTTPADIAAAGLEKGIKVYYPEQHAQFVFTAALKAYKGSDASNLHDEEVGDEEMEFSDDEKEMEHKRRVKAKKLEKRGIVPGAAGRGRGGRAGEHPLRREGLSYDDEEEGPYRPLARPSGFTSGREAPQEAERGYGAPSSHRGDRGRGRGDRGRGGERGRGRGGAQQQAPRYPPAPADAPQDPRKMGAGFGFNPAQGQQQQFAPQGQGFGFQQFGQQPQQQGGQQQFPYAPYGMPPQPWGQIPGGAFLNPAFFGQQQQAQQQQGHAQGQQQQQWTPPPGVTPPLPGQFGSWTPPAPPQPPQMGGGPTPEAARAIAEMEERIRVMREGGAGQ
ncbi:hypothetical protein V497_06407 [Pseudogymnoascus sp. VKM F-4516 (FW-969)]|nr:hypothetical protein V497_06407 [Pseudogymnoascus sp. VKM F-4516 (FW-969)]